MVKVSVRPELCMKADWINRPGHIHPSTTPETIQIRQLRHSYQGHAVEREKN